LSIYFSYVLLNEVAVKATLDRPLRGKPHVYMGTEMAAPEAFEGHRDVCRLPVLEARPRETESLSSDSFKATCFAFDEAYTLTATQPAG
jgi:ethanolamine utilization cobalamin adenosyltransferase